jgi:hypothetical protein
MLRCLLQGFLREIYIFLSSVLQPGIMNGEIQVNLSATTIRLFMLGCSHCYEEGVVLMGKKEPVQSCIMEIYCWDKLQIYKILKIHGISDL